MPSALRMRRVTVLPDNLEDWVENSVNVKINTFYLPFRMRTTDYSDHRVSHLAVHRVPIELASEFK